MNHKWMLGFAISAVLASSTVLLAACGDDDDSGGSSGGNLTTAGIDCKDLSLAAPARIKSAGTFTVASDLSYAPMEFVKEGTNTPIGADVDIANCIAQAWGVKADVQNTPFDSIIASLTSKKVDVILSSMTANDERKKQVDFVEYFTAGSGVLVKKGNPQKINGIADLCGKKVAIQVGTVQLDEEAEQNTKCGDKKISVQTFEQNTDTIQAVSTGRADAAMMDYPVAIYGASKVKSTEVVGEQFDTGNYGIAVRKDDGEVKSALDAAVKAMRDKGKYDAILKYWGLEAGALK
jgi:polar amino acid transport system substrate-binding protein